MSTPPSSRLPGKWQVQSSQTLLKDQWINLRADSCLTSRGKTVEPFYVLNYSPWVSVFAITSNEEILFVRQYRHAIESLTLELPSGGFDPSDSGVLAAAKREMLEETGYSAGHYTEIAKVAPNPSSHTNFNHIIFASNAQRVAAQDLDETEDIEVVLMPVDQVKAELSSGSFVAAIQAAAICHGLLHLDVLS